MTVMLIVNLYRISVSLCNIWLIPEGVTMDVTEYVTEVFTVEVIITLGILVTPFDVVVFSKAV